MDSHIFAAIFPYKFSYFEPLCLLAKMAAETMIRSVGHLRLIIINQSVDQSIDYSQMISTQVTSTPQECTAISLQNAWGEGTLG